VTLAHRGINSDVTSALSRLLSDAALWRAALGACAVPVALLDAAAAERPITYVNPAFETLFGYPRGDALGRSLADVVFRSDEPFVHRLLADPGTRRIVKTWTADGAMRQVEIAFGAVRTPEGRTAHWVVSFIDLGGFETAR
jgi:PAS domain S-box-containing protein